MGTTASVLTAFGLFAAAKADLAIDGSTLSSSWNCYPNGASGKLQINCLSSGSCSNKKIFCGTNSPFTEMKVQCKAANSCDNLTVYSSLPKLDFKCVDKINACDSINIYCGKYTGTLPLSFMFGHAMSPGRGIPLFFVRWSQPKHKHTHEELQEKHSFALQGLYTRFS